MAECIDLTELRRRASVKMSGKRTLTECSPFLATQWHPTKNGLLTVSDVTPKSNKELWWLCDKRHEWKSTVHNRTNGNGCPYCSGRYAITGENDLLTVNPTLAKEWHPKNNGDLTAKHVKAISGKRVWWKCSKGHEWEATIANRSKGRGCPYCSGKKVLVGYNDLVTFDPGLAKQWHPTKNGLLTPKDVTPMANRKAWWICQRGHVWESVISSRSQGTQCPICQNQKVQVGYNDLATAYPELAKEWHPNKNGDLTPKDITVGSGKKVWWKCNKGHEWEAIIYSRNHGIGCPICSGEMHTSFPEQAIYYYLNKSILAEVENRAVVYGKEIDIYIPSWKIGIEYDGIHYHDSDKSKDREERKDKHFEKLGITIIRIKEAEVNSTDYERNIIYCIHRGKTHGYLKEVLRNLSELIGKMTGNQVSIKDIDIRKDRRAIHEQYVLGEKRNSVSYKNCELSKQWHPTKNGSLTPEHFSYSSGKKVWWKCKKGHEWEATISDRNSGRGCPYCTGKRVLVGYNDLATVNSELAAQWHPYRNAELTAKKVTKSSTKKVWWKCEVGHEWQATVYNRNAGRGCPYCSGKKVFVGFNDLATVNPELSKQWHPYKNGKLTPENVTKGTAKKVWWKCEIGHEWQATVNDRNKTGCPICTKSKKREQE